ncbi:hypothetical protein F3Y22_tig00112416pilonHSYRG00007 [Hibiscus syriacus]|uniref:Uncharacterized protein n=1 Tax=Hibiscus syriacus TaxID=106335 RepID=A0A6A2XJK0_HIBSY|nr:hypothetical protein F3Y22_tig00112416pilonHSYRG00007 [Hibiscus syriacus]
MCFLPVVSDNDLVVGKRSKSSGDKPVLYPGKNTKGPDDKDGESVCNIFGRKNKLGRRSLSRFVTAVFFETSLMKKMRNKKPGEKLHRIYNRHRLKSESKPKKNSDPTINDAPCEDVDQSINNISSKASSCLSKISSSSSSSVTSSGRSSSSSTNTSSDRSSSSSLPGNSRPALSKAAGKNEELATLRHGSNTGFCCLLLTSLLVLVIWGKVCAIFCTSAVLLFANRWIKLIKRDPPANVAVVRDLPEIDLKLCRKKIIMEGLLERNHGRNVY